MELAKHILSSLHRSESRLHNNELDWIRAFWPLACGEFLAKNSRPVRIRSAVLTIKVTDSSCMKELMNLRQELVTALKKELPELALRKIEFQPESYSSQKRIRKTRSTRTRQ